MWYKTDLMEEILTSESARKIVDYVSPIYGNSKIALMLFQTLGLQIDDINKTCYELYDQIFINRATWTISYWEKEYGIIPSLEQSIEERRNNILAFMIKKFRNPYRILSIIKILSGIDATIVENTGKNTFLIYFYGIVDNVDEIKEKINEMKPAHLLCDLEQASLTDCNSNLGYGVILSSCEYSSSYCVIEEV